MKNGLIEEFCSNGNISSRKNYKNGKRDGLFEHFWENGNIWYRVNYEDDKKEGLYEQFYENGNISHRINYKNDKFHGLYESFNTDKTLNLWKFFKDDMEITDKYIYLESGEVVSKAEYRNIQIDNIINDI